MRSLTPKVFTLWLGILLAGLLPLHRLAADDQTDLGPTVLQLKWSHQFQFAGYYMAQELGYYRSEGIDLEIRPGGPSLDVTEEVLSGRADFGVGTSNLLLDHAAGKPVVVLGVIYQHSPLVLIMKTEKTSNTIARVAEGPVMIEANSGDLIAMLRRAGLNINQLEITDHPDNAVDLLESTTEAISFSAYQTDEPYTLLEKGVTFSTFTPQTYGIDFYGDNFFTTRHTLKERKKLAEGFRRATIRGWEEAIRDPDKAIKLILEKYPTDNDHDKLRYEANVTLDLMTNLVDPGHMNPERWKHIAQTFQEVGMLEKTPDLKDFIYTEKGITLPKWFWPTLLSASALILLFAIISFHLQNLNSRLHQEVKKRIEAENSLKASNQQLTIEKSLSEEANLKKTWFITNVSHDLRAPVSSMISLTQIFTHHSANLQLPDKFDRFLKQLHSGGEFLMLLLDNILDHSAFEMNAISVCPENVDLANCCEGLINLTQPLADDKGITLQWQQQSEHKHFFVDRTRLAQIVLNLLHNAIKFSPKGGTIFLDLIASENSLEVQITDQGPGIPLERQKELFKMFGEADKTGPHHSSTGLGLSIVKRNVDLLNGTITLKEGTPKGTIFNISIPSTGKESPTI